VRTLNQYHQRAHYMAASIAHDKDYEVNSFVRAVSNGRNRRLSLGMVTPYLWSKDDDYNPTGTTNNVLAFFGQYRVQ
jgi:hypothetical protein